MIKKLTAALLVLFLLIAAFPAASFAEGDETAGPSTEPTATEAPVSKEPQPTETPTPTETPAPTEAPTPMETPAPTPTPTDTPAPETSAVIQAEGERDISEWDDIKDTLSGPEVKLSTGILQLLDERFLPDGTTKSEMVSQMKERGQIEEGPVANGTGSKSSEFLYVYIQLKQGSNFDMLLPYVAQIVNKDREADLVTAYILTKDIIALASLDAVLNITEVTPPRVNAGSVMSQGDSLLSADQMRASLGANGTGVNVGIISNGVRNIGKAIASGDLPSNVNVLSDNYGGDEGTAMLEIVHDLAPGANLYFHDCGRDTIAFKHAISELANMGCKVICDDISWIEDWFFADDDVATYVKNLLATNNITYVSSAGNSAFEHYQGIYYDNGSGRMDFSSGKDAYNTYLYGYVPKDGTLTVVLQWDDPIGSSSNDYDLYLYNADTMGTVAYCANIQNGRSYSNPIEIVNYKSSKDINIAVSVRNKNAQQNKTIELYAYCGNGARMDNINIVPQDSIFGQSAVPGVICVGAVDAAAPNVIEKYSCQGPVTMLTETRQKPDICGIDGVYISGAGNFGRSIGSHYYFYGTSAAAPHIAAVAALLQSKFPLMPASQIKQLIQNSAVDLGNPGYDFVHGFGRANALAAGQSIVSVGFDGQGGSGTSPPIYIAYGTVIQAPAVPSRFGYNFTGWFADAACTAPVCFPYAVNYNQTLYAGWTAQPVSNLLGGVSLSSGSLNRPFSPKVTSYKINIGEYDASFTLTAVKQYDGAFMTMNKAPVTSYPVTVANGKSAKISVKVMLGKKSKTYTFTVTRAKSTNNALSALTATAGAWSQSFDPNVTSYTLYLDENTKSTAIRATAAAGLAKVSPASSKVSLNNGQSKTVRITVRAQSGARRTYMITVVRAASMNANLKSLKCSGLTPRFNPAQTNYTVTLPANKGAISISAKAAGYKAAVSIDGGKASKKLTLANGQSVTVSVVVTSQAGSKKEYVITVTRQ